jgi:DNA-binding NtrC family response regulator
MTTKAVLLVDDDSSVRLSLPAVLSGPDVEVVTASSYEDARAILERHTFDLVITDLRLSGTRELEGLDLIELVRTRAPSTPIILISGFLSGEIAREALERGASQTWLKTIPIRDLVERVRVLGIPAGITGSCRNRSS